MFLEKPEKIFLKNCHHTLKRVALKWTLKHKRKKLSEQWVEQWTWMILITNHLSLSSIKILRGKSLLPWSRSLAVWSLTKISKMVAKENEQTKTPPSYLYSRMRAADFRIQNSLLLFPWTSQPSCFPALIFSGLSAMLVSRSRNASPLVSFHRLHSPGPPRSTALLRLSLHWRTVLPRLHPQLFPSSSTFILFHYCDFRNILYTTIWN